MFADSAAGRLHPGYTYTISGGCAVRTDYRCTGDSRYSSTVRLPEKLNPCGRPVP